MAENTNTLPCGRCGEPVLLDNSVLTFETLMGDPLASFARVDRHLLPVAGEIPCAGSPSRAQYLPGQPRDTRGYGYHDEMEASFRAAFAAMQRVAMAEKAHLN